MTAISYEYLLIEECDGVFIITLNRPQARNAINSKMFAELCHAFDRFESRDDLHVAIISNTGKVFCAGADLKEYDAGTYHAPAGHELSGFGGMTRHYCPKPIIMAVNGKVLGGGAEMLVAADIALISDDGMIGFPEVTHALFPGGGGAPLRIGRSIHFKHAMQLLLTGRPIDAETAVTWGLVNEVCPETELMDRALDMAQTIAHNGPLAVQMIKRAVYDCMDKSFISESDGWRMMADFDAAAKRTEDAKEGTRAFSEKRPPRWIGR